MCNKKSRRKKERKKTYKKASFVHHLNHLMVNDKQPHNKIAATTIIIITFILSIINV